MSKSGDLLKKKLRDNRIRLFTTADAAVSLGVSKATVSVILGREVEVGEFIRLARGRWALLDPNAPHPFAVARFIAHPNSIYITGPSALYHHGILLQIPRTLHAAWSAKPRSYETPLGAYYFHALPAPEDSEIEIIDTPDGPVPIATPEKALVDTARLAASPRGKASLFPELNMNGLDPEKIKNILHQIKKPKYRKRIEALIRMPNKSRGTPLEPILDRLEQWANDAGGWDMVGLFVGAGLSSNVCKNGRPLPLGAELPDRLLDARRFEGSAAEKMRKRLGSPDARRNSLPGILDEIRIAMGKSWDEAVQGVFRNATPNDLFFDAANLGASLFLTTNIDRLLEQSISHREGRNTSYVSWPEEDRGLMNILRLAGPKVVHLHGDVEKPESWVLTQRDYERVKRDKELAQFVTEALLDRPFLFVGFGMSNQDKHLVDVLADLNVNLESWNQEHLALVPEDVLETERKNKGSESDRLDEKLWKDYGVRSLGFPKERIAELFSRLRERCVTRGVTHKGDSPWRREIFRTAMSYHSKPWWSSYQEPRVIRSEEYRKADFDADSLDLQVHVTGKDPGLSPVEVLRERRVILVGDFGVGKSTYLRRRFAEYAQDLKGFRAPPRLFIALRDAKKGQRFADLAAAALTGLNAADALTEFIEASGIFLVDGIDEVAPDNPDLLKDLAEFAKTHRECRFVLSSRPSAFQENFPNDAEDYSGFSSWSVLHILPLSHDQVRKYMKARLGEVPALDEHLWEVFQYPVFLNAYCDLREGNFTIAPESVSGILAGLLEKQLRRAAARKDLVRIDVAIAKEILAEEAFMMEANGTYAKNQGDWFTVEYHGASPELRVAFREELIEGSLLVSRGGKIEFQHRIWQSYLAGLHLPVLAKRGIEVLEKAVLAQLDPRAISPNWYHPLHFAAEKDKSIEEFLWALHGCDRLAVARILPDSCEPQRNQWAFEALLGYYRDHRSFIRREAVGGIFDEDILGRRARKLMNIADQMIRELLGSDEKMWRRLGVQIARAGSRQRVLEEQIDFLLRDMDCDVVAYTVDAAARFNVGSVEALIDALKTLENSEVGYYSSASTILDILRRRAPDVMGSYLTREVAEDFKNNQDLDPTIRWLLPEGKDLLSPEDLERLAAAFPLETPRRPVPRALIDRAFNLQGRGADRILLLGYSIGVREEHHRHSIEEENDDGSILERIEERLLKDPGATRETIFWLLAKVEHRVDLPRRAIKLFVKTGGDPLKFKKELLLDDSPNSIWVARELAEEYWVTDRKMAKRVIAAFALDESELYYPESPRLTLHRRRSERASMEEEIRRFPVDWFYRIGENLAAEVGLLPPELREMALTDSLDVLRMVTPEEAVTPGEGNSFSVNRGWHTALVIIEKLGLDNVPDDDAPLIAGLVRANEHAWFYTPALLKAGCLKWAVVRNSLIQQIRTVPTARSINHILSILRECKVSPDEILENIRDVAERFRDQSEAAFPILSLCQDAKGDWSNVARKFTDSSSLAIRFKALAVIAARAGGNAYQDDLSRYLTTIIEIARGGDIGIWEFSKCLIPVSCAGREEKLADLIKDLYPEMSKRSRRNRVGAVSPGYFEKEAVFRWTVGLLEKGETKRSFEVLEEISEDETLGMSHFVRIAEDAKLNWLSNVASKANRTRNINA